MVVERVDGLERDTLRDLALALRDQNGLRAVVLATAPEGGGAALVAAVTPDSGFDASALLEEAKKLIKGGGGKDPLLAVAGGKDADGIDAALDTVRAAAGIQRLVRALGIDLGAEADRRGRSPTARARSPRPTRWSPARVTGREDHRAIAALAEETGAVALVVGLPLSLDGSVGAAASVGAGRGG